MGFIKKLIGLFGKEEKLPFREEEKLLTKIFEVLYTKEAEVEFDDIHKLINYSQEFSKLNQLHLIAQMALKYESQPDKLSFCKDFIKSLDAVGKTLNGSHSLEKIQSWTKEFTDKCIVDFKVRMIQYQAAYQNNKYSYKGTKYSMMKASKRPLNEEEDRFCLKTAAEIESADNRVKEISSLIRENQADETENSFIAGKIAYKKGVALHDERKNAEALPYFDKAIECGIKEAYLKRCWCLESLHYDFEAIEDFTKAIAINPNDCNLYYGRALAKHGSMDYDGAVADAKLATEYSKIPDEDFEWRTEAMKKKGYSSLSAFYYSYYDMYLKDAYEYKDDLKKIAEARKIGTEESLNNIAGILAMHEISASRSKRR